MDTSLVLKAEEQIAFSAGVVLATSFGYGLYLIIYLISAVLLQQRLSSKPARFLSILTALLFISTTAHLGLKCSSFLTQVRWTRRREASMAQRWKAASEDVSLLEAIALFTQPFNAFIADIIVVWRAMAMWPGNRLVKYGLIGMLVCSAGNSIFSWSTWMASVAHAPGIPPGITMYTGIICATRLFLSFAVNLVATAFIAYRSWQHRRAMLQSQTMTGNGTVHRSYTERALIFLTECGIFFGVIQLATAIMQVVVQGAPATASVRLAQQVMIEFNIDLAAMYPCLVVVIMSFKRSMIHASEDLPKSSFVAKTREDTRLSTLTATANTQDTAEQTAEWKLHSINPGQTFRVEYTQP